MWNMLLDVAISVSVSRDCVGGNSDSCTLKTVYCILGIQYLSNYSFVVCPVSCAYVRLIRFIARTLLGETSEKSEALSV